MAQPAGASIHDGGGMRIAAAVLSLVAPGAGQVLRGRPRRGLAWFAVIGALFLTLTLTGRFGLVAAFGLRIVACPLDALLIRARPSWPGGRVALASVGMGAAMIALTVVVRMLLIAAYRVPSAAMSPTMAIGDLFYVDRTASPGLGDVIVFAHPETPQHDFIERVVAVGGDRIAFVGDQVIRNGVALPHGPPQPCTVEDRADSWQRSDATCVEERLGGHRYRVVIGADPDSRFDEVVVPAGHLFAIGDNRTNSNDSRFWGPVPVGNVHGVAMYRWWSSGRDGVRWARVLTAVE